MSIKSEYSQMSTARIYYNGPSCQRIIRNSVVLSRFSALTLLFIGYESFECD